MHLKKFALGAQLTSSFFFVCLFLVHLLKPNFDPVAKTYSDYAIGTYGYITSLSLISVGSCQLFLGIAYQKIFNNRWLTWLFILAGIGGVATGVFPTTIAKDLNPLRLIHLAAAAIQFGFLPFAFIQLSRQLNSGRFKIYLQLNGLATIIIFSIFGTLTLLGIDKQINYFGLIEKIDILLLITGLLVISFSISYLAKNPSQENNPND